MQLTRRTQGLPLANFETNDNAAASYVPVLDTMVVTPVGGGVITAAKDVEIELQFTPKQSDLSSPLAFQHVKIGYVLDDKINGDIVTGGAGGSAGGAPVVLAATSAMTIVSGYTVDGDRLMAGETAGNSKATCARRAAVARLPLMRCFALQINLRWRPATIASNCTRWPRATASRFTASTSTMC